VEDYTTRERQRDHDIVGCSAWRERIFTRKVERPIGTLPELARLEPGQAYVHRQFEPAPVGPVWLAQVETGSADYPLGFLLTGANVSDYDQAKPLLAAHLRPGSYSIMAKGYDSDAIRAYVNQLGGVAVIAVSSTRSLKPAFDQHLYRERHRIENLFARLKVFRRLATRYEKLLSSFAAMVSLASILVWLKF
jgi:transposase